MLHCGLLSRRSQEYEQVSGKVSSTNKEAFRGLVVRSIRNHDMPDAYMIYAVPLPSRDVQTQQTGMR